MSWLKKLMPARIRTAFPLSPPRPAEPVPSPMDWLASRSLLDDPAPPEAQPLPPVPASPTPQRRRSDQPAVAEHPLLASMARDSSELQRRLTGGHAGQGVEHAAGVLDGAGNPGVSEGTTFLQ